MLFDIYFDLLFWAMSHPLTWRRQSLWPPTRGRLRHFGFTFAASWCHPLLYTVLSTIFIYRNETVHVFTVWSCGSSRGDVYLHELDLPLPLLHGGCAPLLQLLQPLLQLLAPQLGLLLLPTAPLQLLVQGKELNVEETMELTHTMS